MRLVCEGCGTAVTPGPDLPFPARCPNSGDGADHVLTGPTVVAEPDRSQDNPYLRYRARLWSYLLAREHGLTDDAYVALVQALDARIAQVDGHGFRITPVIEALGCTLKDDTGNVGGSHKARHLMGIALWIEVVRALGWIEEVPTLAIASCGNAALGAAVVARAMNQPLQVFIPTSADPGVVERLEALQADIRVCPRDGVGDPTVRAFREAVAKGALPFCVQGTENGLTLDGGRTLGWEIERPVGHVVVQVGGGALASCFARAHPEATLHTVQTEGAWPLKRAYDALGDRTLAQAAADRAALMWPWETEPHSIAHGILDDETYDWLYIVQAMRRTGGHAVIASEALLAEAQRQIQQVGIPTTATGAAGYAGVLALRAQSVLKPDDRVLVLVTGRAR